MTDLSGTEGTTAAETPAEGAENVTGSENAEEKAFSLQDVKRNYFGPGSLGDAQEYVNKVMAIQPEPKVERNFDPEKGLPDGFGLGVIPISARIETDEGGKNVVQKVAIFQIPDLSVVATHEKGQRFVADTIHDHFLNKAANSVRIRPDGSVPASVPESLEDFITSLKGREGLKTFTEIAPAFVKALKKKGIKFMTPALLRQTLQSAQFAAGQFEKISQESWVTIIDKMIAYSKEKGLDPQILNSWKETRDAKLAAEIDDDMISGALDSLE